MRIFRIERTSAPDAVRTAKTVIVRYEDSPTAVQSWVPGHLDDADVAHYIEEREGRRVMGWSDGEEMAGIGTAT